jgi:hypothetical protein
LEIFRQITANNINLVEYPFRRELAMEAYLIENEEILQLDKENFVDVSVLDEEIALEKGRRDKDGRIDLLASYGGEYLAIIELKLNEINESSLKQLEDYLEKKEQILKIGNKDYWNEEIAPKWVGVLIGNSIDPALQSKLSEGYKYKGIPIAGMTIKRFRSKNNDIFVVSDTFFSYNYSKKDYSKFTFKGVAYNKGRLVNAVIRDYVDQNPNVSFSELLKLFPKDTQGAFGVFATINDASETFSRLGHKRHYLKPEELIRLKDAEISTCTQWNPLNIDKFIKIAKKNKMVIERK